jgi:Peptidoglycan-binding protein, CsiV
MNRRMTGPQIAAMLLCLSSSWQAVAQGIEPAEDTEAARQYTVELIIFEYADSSYDGNEIFLPEAVATLPEEEEEIEGDLVFSDIPAVSDTPQVSSKASIEEIPAIRRLDMTLLEPDRYTLNDIYSKLQKLDAYRPILHAGWTQTTVDRDMTASIPLRLLGDVPLRLDGILTLYLSRYLHLVVDLQLDAVALQPVQSPSATAAPYFDKPDLRPATVRYRIFEDRIFKSGDLRYFDHPRFGVLAKITRFDPSQRNPDPAGSKLNAGSSD